MPLIKVAYTTKYSISSFIDRRTPGAPCSTQSTMGLRSFVRGFQNGLRSFPQYLEKHPRNRRSKKEEAPEHMMRYLSCWAVVIADKEEISVCRKAVPHRHGNDKHKAD